MSFINDIDTPHWTPMRHGGALERADFPSSSRSHCHPSEDCFSWKPIVDVRP
ncbi:hypothetical protein [Nocardiopsis xinjiangensis]|uniref:hypothetical protein n=1 Tax=Nocardiopsis xinjiangensis TaxID=124285 RepID=UPI0019D344C1|nr:hypothetical protein [Nocardiopsis xinjiangensis]